MPGEERLSCRWWETELLKNQVLSVRSLFPFLYSQLLDREIRKALDYVGHVDSLHNYLRDNDIGIAIWIKQNYS